MDIFERILRENTIGLFGSRIDRGMADKGSRGSIRGFFGEVLVF